MKTNPAFQKSVHFLIHPCTLLALLLYAVNEFVLQPYYPSWLSGKLSGFTWLFVAPVAAAFVLSLLIPVRWKNQTQWVRALAFGLAALLFIGLKTQVPFHELVLEGWLAVLNFPAAVVLDPTDLLALLILPLSWWLWSKSNPTIVRPFTLRAAWVLPVFALLTLADAPAGPYANMGITDLRLQDDKIIASGVYGIYTSLDSGITWQTEVEEDDAIYPYSESLALQIDQQVTQNMVDIPDKNISYRITENGNIEKSIDGAVTWQLLEGFPNISDAEEYYYNYAHQKLGSLSRTPLDILYDPATENVIIARSLAGVIVISPDGKIMEVGVGKYQPIHLSKTRSFLILMGNYLFLTIALFVLLVNVWFVVFRRWGNRIILFVTLILWFLMVLIGKDIWIDIVFYMTLYLSLLGLFLVFTISNIHLAIKHKNPDWWMSFPYALIGGMLFLIPILLWYEKFLTPYALAMSISIGMLVLWIMVGMIYTNEKYMVMKKNKP